MARINLGNFGQQVAAPTPRVNMPVASDGEGLQNLGQGAQGLAFTRMKQRTNDQLLAERDAQLQPDKAQREREERLREADRARAMEAMAGYEADSMDAADDIQRRLRAGELRPNLVSEELDKALNRTRSAYEAKFSPEHLPTFNSGAIKLQQRLRAGLSGAVDQHVTEQRAASLSATIEQLDRLAVKDPGLAIRRAEGVLQRDGVEVFGAPKAQAMLAGFRERAAFNHLAARVEDLRQDGRGLKSVLAEVKADRWSVLSPEQRNILVSRVDSHIQHIEVMAQQERARREKFLEQSIKDAESVITSGFPLSAQQMGNLVSAAKGTPFEAQAKGLVSLNGGMSQFMTLSPPAQDAAIAKQEAAVRESPTRNAVALLEKMRKVRDATVEQVTSQPLETAVARFGAQAEPLSFPAPGELTTPASIEATSQRFANFGQEVRQRVAAVRAMQSLYGPSVPTNILFDSEAKTIGAVLKQATPQQQSYMLGTLVRGIGDPGLAAAAMQQLAKDSPMPAVAGIFFAKDRPGSGAAAVAEAILHGDAMLREKQMKLPPEKEIEFDFKKAVGHAFDNRPEARKALQDAALRVYATLASREGRFDGNLEPRLMYQALDMVLGGKVMEFNGADIVPPYRMDPSLFRDRARRALRDAGVPESLPLENVAGGYAVRNGLGYLPDPKSPSRPLIIQIDESPRTHGVGPSSIETSDDPLMHGIS